MSILKIFIKNIVASFFIFFLICISVNNCYSEYTIMPGETISFTANNAGDSADSMTGINITVTKTVIQGVDFLEKEEDIPDSILVGENASLVYRAVGDAENGSIMEISFQLQGPSGSPWIPSVWEETVTINYNTAPNGSGIPTLSEWKRYFLILFSA